MSGLALSARLAGFAARGAGQAGRLSLTQRAACLPDVTRLNSGDPDLTAAPVVVESACNALETGRSRYALGGLPELRQALAVKLATENGIRLDPGSQIIITNGSAEAANVVFQTLLDPGDEVLTTDPHYDGHVRSIILARGVPVLVPTDGDAGWEVDPDEVERRITPSTKAFVFANPGNPTGAVYREETLLTLLEIARRHGIVLVVDELFERYVYDGRQHVSAASLPHAGEHVITLGGFSKSYCMTGWRLGWIAAPIWAAAMLGHVQYALSLAASTASQWGGVAALSEAARPYYEHVYRTYGERRQYFFHAVSVLGLPQRPAPGAFLGMLDIRPTGLSSAEVAELLLERARVLVWPGAMFGSRGEGWLRISLICPTEILQKAIERMTPVIRELLARRPLPGVNA